MDNSIQDLRKEYKKASLEIDTVETSPLDQFQKWFEEALSSDLNEPNAMTLATANRDGVPRARTVLLKAFDQRGFVFYTNYNSTKAKHIQENPNASLLFPWLPLERQVVIVGSVEKVSVQQSIKYFTSRPEGSQLGAWISDQSSVITSRKILEMKYQEIKRKFKKGKIPLPDFWGGYRVIPFSIEFWQGRPNRLHDRIHYALQEDSTWKIERLSP